MPRKQEPRSKLKMLKSAAIALSISAVTVLGVSSSVTVYDTMHQESVRQAVQSTLVKVRGEKGYGSGVIISSNDLGSYILTNKHVCQLNQLDATLKEIVSGGISSFIPFNITKIEQDKTKEVKMKGYVVKVAENMDLCLLYTDYPNLPVAKISKTKVKIGDKLYGYSNPRGFEGVPSTGYAFDVDEAFFMQFQAISVLAQPGSSGSGVFNEEGELVGLISMRDNKFSYMVPLMAIQAFIQEFM